MPFILDKATVHLHDINPDLIYARCGATHMLSVRLHAHTSDGTSTLDSSIPLPVRIGDPVLIPLPPGNPHGLHPVIYGWNGSMEAPTLEPPIRDNGPARFGLTAGWIVPLPENREPILDRPIRVSAG